MQMDIHAWQVCTGVFAVICLVLYGQASYWKAKSEVIDKERGDSGWESEAMFWRRHFDKDAAAWAVDECDLDSTE
jgi:hypothetical protein